MNTREMRERRAKLIAEAQQILRNESRSAEDIAKANRILDDADGIKTQYETIERGDAAEAEARAVRPAGAPAPGVIDANKAQKEAFRQYIVTGKVTAEAAAQLRSFDRNRMATVSAEQRDMNGSTGSDGGYIIPTGFNPSIDAATLAYGKMLTVVSNWNTESGQPIQWPLTDDVANYSQEMTDGTDVNEVDIPLGQVTFNCSTFSTGVIKVSRSLITDAAFNLDSFINENFGVRYARGLNKAVTLGSTSGSVQGIVGAATVGATSGAPTAITFLDLVALYGALDPSYVGNATWAFNNAVLKALIGLEDNYGRPLFVPSMTSGMPDTILGRPYVLNQDMVSPAAGTKSILFGDATKYKLRNVGGGMEVLRLSERYAPAHQVGFVGFHRHSGKLLDAGTHPVVVLQQHA